MITKRPVAMADIDFTALRRQANEALDKLRQADRRQVPASSVAF